MASAPAFAVAIAAPAAAACASSSIEELFQQWQANSVTSDDGMLDEEREALCDEYRRLQVAIIGAVPTTAREVAMQFWCDCDSGSSHHSEGFQARMLALAGVEAVS
jgi:hypothetical protein